jgi:hypothetical protein
MASSKNDRNLFVKTEFPQNFILSSYSDISAAVYGKSNNR